MTGEAFRAIQSRLAEFQESGNSGPLLDGLALDEVADLRQSLGWPAFGALPDNRDVRRELNSIVLAGTFLWMRAQRLPEADQLDARLEATELLAAAYAAEPAAVPRPLAAMLSVLAGGALDLDHAVLHDHAIDELTTAARGIDLSALDHAIWLLTCAIRAAADDPFEAYYRSDLGTAWLDRFQVTGRIRDLDNAVAAHERALLTTVPVPEDQAGRLSNYSAALLARFGQCEDARDLDRALAIAREAARLSGAVPARGPAVPARGAAAPTRAQRLARLASLARLSAARLASFEQRGDRADLDEAVQASRLAAALAPAGDPAHSRHQALLAQVLLERFARSWNEADLTEAQAAAQVAADAPPDRPAARTPGLAALARAYVASYAFYGNSRDLDAAITSGRAAVAAGESAVLARNVSFGHALSLVTLGVAAQLRYEHAGDAGALTESITLYGRALLVTAVTHAERRRFLFILGNALRVRFSVAGNGSDIRKSVAILSEAVALARPGDPGRLGSVASLARSLVLAAQAGDGAALDQAITLAQRELSEAPAGADVDDHGRPAVAAALGYAWRARFDAAGDDDPTSGYGPLGRAITAFRQAADELPAGHPRRAEYLAGLGSVLRRRYERTGDEPAAADAITASAAAARAAAADPRVRVRAAADWGQVAVRRGDAAQALAGLGAAVRLLDLVAGSPPRRDHLDPLGRLTTLTCDAAAWAITAGHPEQAVELLEHGRTVLLATALGNAALGNAALGNAALGDTGRDLERIRPDLAARLASADRLLAGLPGPGHPMQAGAEVLTRWREQHAAARESLLAEIRDLPGLADFGRPAPFATLREAAAGGPVVIINVSAHRCDALTVTPAGVQVTELPALTAAEVSGRATDFTVAILARNTPDLAKRGLARTTITQTLAWLWDTVITPLLPALPPPAPAPLAAPAAPADLAGLTTMAAPVADSAAGVPSRIWWCPTGPMTFLPLHAAGHPGEHDDAVAARFVSSYAPTLGQLRRARATAAPAAGRRSLVVALSGRPGRGFRAAGRAEGRAVARRLAPAVLLRGSRATAAAVTGRLAGGAPWVHVACRGAQDAGDPAAGGLALADGLLRAGTLAGLRLAGAELAVLADCDLALGGTRLADEVVSLAAVFQRAGYRHVIGTLWAPPDDPGLAEQVYAELGAPGAPAPGAAAALHRAVAGLRRAYPDEPWRWAPFVHLGP